MRVLLAALALGGCTPPPQSTPAPPEDRSCDAAAAQRLVRREGSPQVAEEAQRLAGAKTVRFLHPGQIVTMEYRAGRLNLWLDENNRVMRISCG